MSAFNIFIDDQEAFLFSDTMVYSHDGKPNSHASKAYPLPIHRAAFGGRGAVALKAAVLLVIETSTPAGETFDALTDRLESVFDQAFMIIEPTIQGPHSVKSELFFVGWSDREQRMKGSVVYNRDDLDENCEFIQEGTEKKFVSGMRELGRYGFIECPKTEGTEFEIDMRRFGDFGNDGVPAIGTLIMDRQRQLAIRHLNGCIGGEVMLTHVSRNAVTMRSLHRWEPGAPPLFPV
ncbi:hypothetical protein [Azospirillum sp. B510]|uniref:hypothetical protein n=1 Tax=Azospirillum sp. (strain B510) TaxID=137722 RepID=UPI0011D15F03|nr:hypothetical protein [Azospirillum sp. B510]